MKRLRLTCTCFLGFMFSTLPALAWAQESVQTKTPFDSYVRVAEKFFVYEQSLISPYTGPDVTHWNLLIPHEIQESHDSEMVFYDRKRLGVVALTPALRVYVDIIGDPMTEYYEFRDIKDGKLIHKFSYYGGLNGGLMVNGQGVIYQYNTPKEMCFGNETTKFVIKKGKFVEVPQPVAYWENTETTTTEDVTLFFEQRETSPHVATLTKGTTVSVLAHNGLWFLIKTPLGLTGWIPFTVKRIWDAGGQKNLIDAPTLDRSSCN